MKSFMTSLFISIFVTILLCAGLISVGGVEEIGNNDDKKTPSFYKPNVNINGNSSEWESSLFYFDSDAKTAYALVNDKDALYICLKVMSEDQQIKMIHSGVEIWIDPKGKKNKTTGMICHFEGSPIDNKKLMNRPGGMPGQNKNKFLSTPRIMDITLKGFKDEVNGTLPINRNTTGIQVALNLDSTGILVFEAKIPFAVFNSDIKMAKAISLGCVFPGREMPQMGRGEGEFPDRDGSGGGMPGGGIQGEGMQRGGMPGGGRPGGQGRRMGGGNGPDQIERQNLSKENTFWHKAAVAQPGIK